MLLYDIGMPPTLKFGAFTLIADLSAVAVNPKAACE
jgi:hypothetical protein